MGEPIGAEEILASCGKLLSGVSWGNITAERDGYYGSATVISRTVLKEKGSGLFVLDC